MEGSKSLVEERNKSSSRTSRTLRIVAIALIIVLAIVIIGVAIGVPLSKRGQKQSFTDPSETAMYVLKSVPLIDG